MTRKKTQKVKAGQDAHLSVTLNGALIHALDEEAERMESASPGLSYTRSDALRAVLHGWMATKTKEIKNG